MIYLSAEQVLFLHDQLIEETGGEHGVRDLGGLESALARPQAAFGDTEFYPDVFTKAAVLIDGLTRNHAFIDDNKRISISTAVLFLQVNCWLVSHQDSSDKVALIPAATSTNSATPA